jgi:hypothetical protein
MEGGTLKVAAIPVVGCDSFRSWSLYAMQRNSYHAREGNQMIMTQPRRYWSCKGSIQIRYLGTAEYRGKFEYTGGSYSPEGRGKIRNKWGKVIWGGWYASIEWGSYWRLRRLGLRLHPLECHHHPPDNDHVRQWHSDTKSFCRQGPKEEGEKTMGDVLLVRRWKGLMPSTVLNWLWSTIHNTCTAYVHLLLQIINSWGTPRG